VKVRKTNRTGLGDSWLQEEEKNHETNAHKPAAATPLRCQHSGSRVGTWMEQSLNNHFHTTRSSIQLGVDESVLSLTAAGEKLAANNFPSNSPRKASNLSSQIIRTTQTQGKVSFERYTQHHLENQQLPRTAWRCPEQCPDSSVRT
jgi:nitrogenase molybdenum-iron protein alpha/beta subunit